VKYPQYNGLQAEVLADPNPGEHIHIELMSVQGDRKTLDLNAADLTKL